MGRFADKQIASLHALLSKWQIANDGASLGSKKLPWVKYKRLKDTARKFYQRRKLKKKFPNIKKTDHFETFENFTEREWTEPCELRRR